MRINELGADEFMAAMAQLGDAVDGIINGECGKGILADFAAFQALPANERKGKATAWAVGLLAKYLPELMRSNVEDVYRVLAACDGQTLDEYKAAFSVKKLTGDIAALKAALGEGGELKGLVAPFFG